MPSEALAIGPFSQPEALVKAALEAEQTVTFQSDPTLAIGELDDSRYQIVYLSSELAPRALEELRMDILEEAHCCQIIEFFPAGSPTPSNGKSVALVYAFLPDDVSHEILKWTIELAMRHRTRRVGVEDMRDRLVDIELALLLSESIGEHLTHGVRKQAPQSLGKLSIGTLIAPLDGPGGDSCGWFSLPADIPGDNKFAMYLYDCAGHDLAAAFISTFIEGELDLLYATKNWDILSEPARVMQHLNAKLIKGKRSYATMIYMVVDEVSGQTKYCSAGHTPFFTRSADSEDNEIKLWFSNCPQLGMEHQPNFEQKLINVRDFTHITLYSDGLPGYNFKQKAEGEEEDKETKVMKQLHRYAGHNARKFTKLLYSCRSDITGEMADSDDISILVLRSDIDFAERSYDGVIPERQKPKESTYGLGMVVRNIGARIGHDKEEKELFARIVGHADLNVAFVLEPQIEERLTDHDVEKLVIDCREMVGMDSTFIAFLHYINRLCTNANVSFHLHIRSKGHEDNLRQMHMTGVVNHLSYEPVEFNKPLRHVSREIDRSSRAVQLYLYRRHKDLLEIHPDNEDTFGEVVRIAGQELGEDLNEPPVEHSSNENENDDDNFAAGAVVCP